MSRMTHAWHVTGLCPAAMHEATRVTCSILHVCSLPKTLFNSLMENLILLDLMHTGQLKHWEWEPLRIITCFVPWCTFVWGAEEWGIIRDEIIQKSFYGLHLVGTFSHCALTLVWSRSALHSSSIFKPAHFSIPIISVTNHFVSSDWVLHEREFIRQGKISSWK